MYEYNALIAIENKDFHHFSKCLGNLVDLYEMGLPGKQNEFYLYQLVSVILKSRASELHNILTSLP